MTKYYGDFTFLLWDGSNPTIDMAWQDKGFSERRSRLGLRVLRFPAPYEDLELVDGERVGEKKWTRVKAALIALGGEVK